MITDKEKNNLEQFYRAILSIKDEEECRQFFDDVATIREMLDRKPFLLRFAVIFIGIMAVIVYGVYGSGYNPADFVYMQF